MNRRCFLQRTSVGITALTLLENSASVWGAPANGKLDIGLVGVGGRGSWFVGSIPDAGGNLVAFCDVDDAKNPSAYERFPEVRRFHDYRRMLDEMDKQLDAVIVAAPDHIHAPASVRAMEMGKHVYCEKPLTNTVRESRRVREVSRLSGVATQMGNQGTSSEAYRRAVELIRGGVLGEVRAVHAWNNQGGPGPRPLPQGNPAVPGHIQWDLWLGPRRSRPYHRDWLNWHGWREFGTGNLGNWAPHMLNLPFRSLELGALWSIPQGGQVVGAEARRLTVEAEVSELDDLSVPKWEIIRFGLPARTGHPSVVINWYNGAGSGFRGRLEELMGRRLDWGDAGGKKWADWAGVLMVGEKGMLQANAHNTEFTLLPAGGDDGIPRTLPRSPGHEHEWIQACKGAGPAMSHFDYAGPLSELCLLGNVATQHKGQLIFDPADCRILNNPEADGDLERTHRPGWEV